MIYSTILYSFFLPETKYDKKTFSLICLLSGQLSVLLLLPVQMPHFHYGPSFYHTDYGRHIPHLVYLLIFDELHLSHIYTLSYLRFTFSSYLITGLMLHCWFLCHHRY